MSMFSFLAKKPDFMGAYDEILGPKIQRDRCPLLSLINTIEWRIPEIRVMSYGFYETFYSPIYEVRNSKWRLEASKTDMLRIFLFNVDPGPPKTFTCTIKSNVNDRVHKHIGNFQTNSVSWEPVVVFASTEALLVRNVVITCCIEKNTSHMEANTLRRKSKSRAVQTEDTNSVTGIKTPKVEDWSSIDIKETLRRKSKSRAVQTEDTNSVTGIKKPKVEDWSSIDIKDATLFRERMKELLTKGSDHDVTICVQGKQYRAHRNILSTRSPVFAMMLSHDSKEKNTGVIKIKDCDPDSFYEFLLYVYSGRTENLTPGNALKLYYSADKYDFPVLKERCVKILKNSLSVESICDVVLLASKHLEKELLQVATEFFAQNMKKILVTVRWQKFMSQNSVAANELLIKSTEIKNPEN